MGVCLSLFLATLLDFIRSKEEETSRWSSCFALI